MQKTRNQAIGKLRITFARIIRGEIGMRVYIWRGHQLHDTVSEKDRLAASAAASALAESETQIKSQMKLAVGRLEGLVIDKTDQSAKFMEAAVKIDLERLQQSFHEESQSIRDALMTKADVWSMIDAWGSSLNERQEMYLLEIKATLKAEGTNLESRVRKEAQDALTLTQRFVESSVEDVNGRVEELSSHWSRDVDAIKASSVTKTQLETQLRKQAAQLELRVHDWLHSQHTSPGKSSGSSMVERLAKRMKSQCVQKMGLMLHRNTKARTSCLLRVWFDHAMGRISSPASKMDSIIPTSPPSRLEINDLEEAPVASPAMAGWRLNLERAMVVKNRVGGMSTLSARSRGALNSP